MMELTISYDLEKLEGSPSLRYGHSTCIVGKELFLYGGSSLDGKIFYNTLHILDLEEMKWKETIEPESEEIQGRHFHSMVATSNDSVTARLIIFGGKSNGYKNDVIIFTVSTREFELVKPKFKDEKVSFCVHHDIQPPTPRYGHSSCFFDERVFIFGGYDRNGFTKNDLYCFNFQTNMWKKFIIARIPFRYHHSSICIGGNYFILGGIEKDYSPLSDVYRLDLSQVIASEEGEEDDDHAVEAFELSIENPIASYGHKCFIQNDRIFMYGGRDEEREFKHLLRLEQQSEGNLRWVEEKEVLKIDESKLLMSYGSLDIYEEDEIIGTKLLFFGGQIRGEKNKILIKKKKKEEENNLITKIGADQLPYDCIFIIFSFLKEKDIIMVCSTSKYWALSICARSDRLWVKKYEKSKKKKYNTTPINKYRLKKVKREKTSYHKYMMLKNMQKIHYREISEKEEERERIQRKKMYEYKSNGEENIKLVVVGDSAVGKTCMLISYANNNFPNDYIPTVFDNYVATVLYENKYVRLGLWDTAGEDYDDLRSLNYPGTNIFLLCFSLIDPTSFENIEIKWYPEITSHVNKDVPFLLIGTKLDLREDSVTLKELKVRGEKPVTRNEGEKLVRELKGIRYLECSSKTKEGLKEVFQEAVHVVMSLSHEDDNKDKCGIM